MPLPEIIEALTTVEQKTIQAAQVYGDLPEAVLRLPAILNVPREGSIPFGERDVTYPVRHTIDVQVLLSRSDQPTQLRQALAWIEPLRAALDRDHTLGGKAHNAGVTGYKLGSVQYGGTTYIALVISVRVDELVVAGEVAGG